MRFLHPEVDSQKELTFADLFIMQQYSEVTSRRNIDLTPPSPLSTTLPIISANMNSVTGKRMSETLARYGAMGVLPQDMSLEKTIEIIDFIHNANATYDTPLKVTEKDKVRDARGIINKRDHDAVVMIDEKGKPLSIFTNSDIKSKDEYQELGNIKKGKLITAGIGVSYEEAYNMMSEAHISSLPIVNGDGHLTGMLTKKDAVRGDMYSPSLNRNGQLNVSVALGINAYTHKIDDLLKAGIDTLVIDTAHGLQKTMIDAIKDVRNIVGNDIQIIAGNICSGDGAEKLFAAGANGVKVGIGPGAMCTTRMQTGVGRPQFSAIKDCAQVANQEEGTYVWADGGIKDPRDLALALAAGATHGMIGTILAGTHESTGDMKEDQNGNKYKQSHGMASAKAVQNRNDNLSEYEQARRGIFKEGISTSQVYVNGSTGDLIDKFTSGLRSTMSYTGADNIADFQKNALIGVQTGSGYAEGKPHKVL